MRSDEDDRACALCVSSCPHEYELDYHDIGECDWCQANLGETNLSPRHDDCEANYQAYLLVRKSSDEYETSMRALREAWDGFKADNQRELRRSGFATRYNIHYGIAPSSIELTYAFLNLLDAYGEALDTLDDEHNGPTDRPSRETDDAYREALRIKERLTPCGVQTKES